MNLDDLKVIARITGNDAMDSNWRASVVETEDTLKDFVKASKKWTRLPIARFGSVDGFRCVTFVTKRKTRETQIMTVIDFGYARIVIDEPVIRVKYD